MDPKTSNVFKIVFLGGPAVGKTSIIQRCVHNDFKEKYTPTVEEMYFYKLALPGGHCGRFEVVDTSGLLEFSAMIDLRISQAQALVVVYAIDNERSFLLAKSLCERIRQIKGGEFKHILLVGNKLDSIDRKVSTVSACRFVGWQPKCLLVESSAKYDLNVKAIFNILLDSLSSSSGENKM
ncbi:GTP-binding protein Di-Ras1-like [Saccostrea echinata]|uniref:GTP-binding protein Di-Ras1-like n=1 Tax=Saccostrea echinata TaxID=191078 RepID=UPI002A805159|nr:GTP-binding protein Di-Ras1-like [Saccostrea echinata]